MMMFKAVFVSVLLVSIEALASPSLLGICSPSWNCEATKALYAPADKLYISYLENTFNQDCSCVDELLQDSREKIIRVHLINSPCMRNRRCGPYEVLYRYNKVSASRAVHVEGSRLNRRFNAVLERFKKRLEGKDVTCLISPCLECDLDERARRALGDRVSAALPNCSLVDNPYKGPCLRGAICEYHGTDYRGAAPCIADMDGTSGLDLDVKNWSRQFGKCGLRFYWEPWMNCLSSSGPFITPRKRNCGSPPITFERVRERLCRYSFPSFATCLP